MLHHFVNVLTGDVFHQKEKGGADIEIHRALYQVCLKAFEMVI